MYTEWLIVYCLTYYCKSPFLHGNLEILVWQAREQVKFNNCSYGNVPMVANFMLIFCAYNLLKAGICTDIFCVTQAVSWELSILLLRTDPIFVKMRHISQQLAREHPKPIQCFSPLMTTNGHWKPILHASCIPTVQQRIISYYMYIYMYNLS